jgi:FtsH-binding integral membrane protein
MEPNSENVQYQTGGYAPYDPNYDAYNAKPAEPMMQPQYANNEPPAFGNDVENQKENLDSDVPIDYLIRRGFIIKTYGILLTQLIITGVFICLSFVPSVNDFIKSDDFARGPFFITFLILFLIITITVCIMFSCVRDTARKFPINYILLFAFTLSMSFYCLIFCAFFDPQDVIAAAILTIAATIGLTVYAIRTKDDFSYLGGLLFCFMFLSIFTIGFYFWIRATIFWLALGVLVYSLYIIYDTQLIMGNVGVEYSIDDYCFAALNLYIDIIYLFLRILQIIAMLKGK